MSKYLISFDLNQDCLKEHYHANHANNAYANIAQVLRKHGFDNIQGSVYLSNSDKISEAHGTIAIQEITAMYDWFAKCVSNIKFYRLESDLDAQFIVDDVEKKRQAFMQHLQQLHNSLIQAGLSEDKIKKILNEQHFVFADTRLPLTKMKNIHLP